MKGKINKKGAARFLTTVIILAMITVMAFDFTAEPVSAEDNNVVYPNSAMLESILNDRAFVVQALKIKARDEEDYGGNGFSNNPHFSFDHYMYEDLLNEYETDKALKALVNLYWAKSNLENYPIEILGQVINDYSKYNVFLYTIKSASGEFAAANRQILQSYMDLGGTFPTQTASARIQELIQTDEAWCKFRTVRSMFTEK